MSPKKVKIVPKDSYKAAFELEVVCWYHSHGAFTFVLLDGSAYVYPDVHIWRVEIAAN